ncbi:MAG: sulfatase [Halobacteriales archaeon]|nr:sulfatase [Halobacteriales archaeon]
MGTTQTTANVLLVVLDSVRARNMSLYGHENATTPFLEEFAARATVYRQARSPGTWSLPSHVSLFTGHPVASHGITSIGHRLRPGHTFYDTLRSDGYSTGVFSENPFLTQADTGLADAFDHVEGPRNLLFDEGLDPTEFTLREGYGEYLAYLKACIDHDHVIKSLANGLHTKVAWDLPWLLPWTIEASTPGRVYTDLFLEWVEDQDRWAACINYMDTHHPYEPETRFDKWGGARARSLQRDTDDQVWDFLGERRPWWQLRALESLYDGTILQVDEEIRRVIDGLETLGELEETLVVITSDHGEGFGEVGHHPPLRAVGHGPGLQEPLVHVPLLVKVPGQQYGSFIESPASLSRVADAVSAVRTGESVEDAFTRDPVVTSNYGLNESGVRKATQYGAPTDLLTGESHAVYDEADPGIDKFVTWQGSGATLRVVDSRTAYALAHDDGGRVEAVLSDLPNARVRTDRSADIDDETKQRLEHLGYR